MAEASSPPQGLADRRVLPAPSLTETEGAVSPVPALSESWSEDEPNGYVYETIVTSFSSSSSSSDSSSTGMDPNSEKLMTLLKATRAQDPKVQRIVLEGKPLLPAYLIALLKALEGHSSVRQLTLSRVMTVPKGGDDDEEDDDSTNNTNKNHQEGLLKAIADCLRATRSLKHLDLSRNSISCGHALAQAVQHNKTLTRLVLEGNSLDDSSVQALCHACRDSNIGVLKLGRNPIGRASVQAICDLLLWQCQDQPGFVKNVDLRGNNLGSAVALLATALAHPKCRVQCLCLGRNDMDSATVQTLAVALETNQHLRTLDLQRNEQVDDRAAASIVQALAVNHTFTKLKLRYCSVTDEWKNELLQALLLNIHGPELARQTKQVLGKLANMEQRHQRGSSGVFKRVLKSEDASARRTEALMINEKGIDPPSLRTVRECVICCNPQNDESSCGALLLPCTHHNCCLDCASRLRDCHMCRQVVVKVLPLSKDIPLTDGLYPTLVTMQDE